MVQPAHPSAPLPVVLWNDVATSQARLESQRRVMIGLLAASVVLAVVALTMLGLSIRMHLTLQAWVFGLLLVSQALNFGNALYQLRSVSRHLQRVVGQLVVDPVGLTINGDTFAWSAIRWAKVRGLKRIDQPTSLILVTDRAETFTLATMLRDQQGRQVPAAQLIELIELFIPVKG